MDKNHTPQATRYQPVIGLEVHVELKTQSKMFCRCSADYFGKAPNTHTCPVCLGLPGALPYPNKTAIEWCIKIAQALNCSINEFSKFDRKNYFYPDLAKGYQISQYDLPFGKEGSIEVQKDKESKESKVIGITRVHMEEDTGKLSHEEVHGEKVSLVDFNRSGVPLVEIVTEPDFENEYQVVQYLQKLQKIVRYLGVSNADMEKGDMRLEPNISLRKVGEQGLPKYKVEVKNINSFRFVEKAITFEINRHAELLDAGETPAQETRGWNENKNATISQRSKEEAHDYRYFPEPDMPPVTFSKGEIESLKDQIGELPDEKQARFEKEYSLSSADAEILTREKELADKFEKIVKAINPPDNITAKDVANVIINKKVEPEKALEEAKAGKKKDEINPEELQKLIEEVLKENSQAVTDYKNGKENVIMFLLGMVMRKAGKKLDANLVKNRLQEDLQK
ncbi:MAG: Asp-tRNA(Asn)/Glu-tRNA(Gln) amidotransferase subunit GatB [Candidatus Levyibacteriota bacterium]